LQISSNYWLILLQYGYLDLLIIKINYLEQRNTENFMSQDRPTEKKTIDNSKLEIIQVKWLDRWQVYYRLRDLDVECFCQSNQPLKASVKHTQAAIQIWSVAKQFTANRQELIHWLDRCWQIKSCQ
jgi:hypothetical protein